MRSPLGGWHFEVLRGIVRDNGDLTGAGCMIFWIFCALLTTGIVVYLMRPLVRAHAHAPSRAEADVQVYKDQLEEIDRDRDRGLIAEREAEAARIEISRRLLGASEGATASQQQTRAQGGAVSPVFAGAVAGFLVLGTLVAYLGLGQPGQPGTVHAERVRQDPRQAPVSEQIARVEARLHEFPEDGAGWDVIAPVYLKLGRNSDAANAFKRAMSLRGEDARRLSGYTQARLAMTRGIVAQDIHEAFQKLIKLRPDDVPARFWLAMAKEQAGKTQAAARDYQALFTDGRVSERLRALIRERLAAVGAPLPEASPDSKVAAPAPSGAAAIAALPEAERRKAIEGMVAGLAQRLSENGNDPAGWLRLIRAYAMLGQREKAKQAVGAAREALKGKTEDLGKIDQLVNALGLAS